MQQVSNSLVRDRLMFRQSGLGSVCVLASFSAGFGFCQVSSQISSQVWFGFMLKSRVWVCKKIVEVLSSLGPLLIEVWLESKTWFDSSAR